MGFKPTYTVTSPMAKQLMNIEGVKQSFTNLPVTPQMLASLRKTARICSTHYSTQIEGNQLLAHEVRQVLHRKQHFPGRERDEGEIKGYYAALHYLENQVAQRKSISETTIQTLHALAMGEGVTNVQPTPYRDGQNIIRDSRSGAIVYMPPAAKDVHPLMKDLVCWIQHASEVPVPLVAGIAHYQFATIHPYYDGNGRTARLLTVLILHLGGYDLKGLYALEEYYARDLGGYYEALCVGPSHNYYLGRQHADITQWLSYFIGGMVVSFESVKKQAVAALQKGALDKSSVLKQLNAAQRKALELFHDHKQIRATQLVQLFGIKPRTATAWCSRWVQEGFLTVADPSRRARRYALAKQYETLLG